MIPEELRYTEEHEWVATKTEVLVRVGITEYAQQQLGDVVFVQLPEVGDRVEQGSPIGEVESTKSVSELYAPLTGEVTAVNDEAVEAPDLLNSDPYGEGWLVEITIDDPDAVEALLDAEGYQPLTRD
ncbi:Glycine cleavage system H protein [Actinokineospora spheciospongiae]|uniref:Glycine cleavage system H protein n=1 Tax=Actinokineospora spheciospongiae TaxID=909613 RepID=W7IGB4_9PSEU|nr:glycine cleavage system protein GcvH [Actinokineospora spheciospongiae]EWC59940.1 Glycine cleavage system H protein [Actinokineospora spheciospongiae]PWW52237.1 glycine cleavage system H protein [Actinokineospora spheciospongiae]